MLLVFIMNETKENLNQKEENPLSCFFRQPKIYLKLPSEGKYYKPGDLEMPATGEIAVYPMTAKDELILKTPDALLNGQAIVNIIRSCIPALKNPWNIPSIDLDVILIAIKIASYGETAEFNTKCPKCEEENKYDVPLSIFLEQLQNKKYIDRIELEQLVINVQPLTYQDMTKVSLRNFEEQKLINHINDTESTDEEKLQNYNESLLRITEYHIDILTKTIQSVEFDGKTITNTAHICELIEKADRGLFEKITNLVDQNREEFQLDPLDIICPKCEHKYKIPLTMDDAFFFALDFLN